MIKTITFDIDGVIAEENENHDYANAKSYSFAIDCINKLYDLGYTIKLQTARYNIRDKGNEKERGYDEAVEWLNRHGVKFHELAFGKLSGDLYCDDKGFKLDSSKGNVDWDKLEGLLMQSRFEVLVEYSPNWGDYEVKEFIYLKDALQHAWDEYLKHPMEERVYINGCDILEIKNVFREYSDE